MAFALTMALADVIGGDILPLVWGICTVVYLASGLLRRKHRGRKGRRQLLVGLLLPEALTDFVCFSIFFPRGEYRNWGVGGTYVVFLWPAVLLSAYIYTAAWGAKAASGANESVELKKER